MNSKTFLGLINYILSTLTKKTLTRLIQLYRLQARWHRLQHVAYFVEGTEGGGEEAARQTAVTSL